MDQLLVVASGQLTLRTSPHLSRRTARLSSRDWMNAEATQRFGKEFADLNETEQHAVCDDICYKPKVKPAFAKAAEFFTRYRDLTAGGFYSTLAGRKDLSDIGNVPLSTFDGPSARGPEACRAE